jgi:hypothetical protein
MKFIKKYFILIFVIIFILFCIVVVKNNGTILGATIFTTDTTDTLNTFRTNVNNSLTNLNNAISSALVGDSNFSYTSSTGILFLNGQVSSTYGLFNRVTSTDFFSTNGIFNTATSTNLGITNLISTNGNFSYLSVGTSTQSSLFTIATSTSATPFFTVLPNGNIGVGTNNPGTYKFYTNGNLYATKVFASDLQVSTELNGYLKTDGNGDVSASFLAAGTNATFSTAGSTTTIAVTSTPSFTSVIFPDSTTISTAYKDVGFNVINTTSTNFNSQKTFFKPITIVEIYCNTKGGANITIGADERASSTPGSAGTDVFSSGSMVCDADGNATSTFANSGIAAGAILNFDIDATVNSTSSLTVGIKYKND